MAAIGIADMSGMMPLRDPILLPDNYAQFAQNTWLYKGAIRGFRLSDHIFQLKRPTTTKQIYRIPLNSSLEDWVNSLWLEFPDPYMKVIHSPVVGDQFDRYYFFPSKFFADDGSGWFAKPFYAPLANIKAGGPYYLLGIPVPAVTPGVVPSPTSITLTTTAPTPAGDTILGFASVSQLGIGREITDLTVQDQTLTAVSGSPAGTYTIYLASTATLSPGMNVDDLTTHSISLTATADTAAGDSVLTFASTTGVTVGMNVSDTSATDVVLTSSPAGWAPGIHTDAILFPSAAGVSVGMLVANNTSPGTIVPGTVVTSVNLGTNVVIISNGALSPGFNYSDVFKFSSSNAVNSTVASVTPTTVTLNSPVNVGGVFSGDNIQFSTNNPIQSGSLINAISPGKINISLPMVSGGVLTGDQIHFTAPNPIYPGTTITELNFSLSTVRMSAAALGAGVFTGDQIEFDTFAETRAYVYTYVSAYGEEGPASPATVDSGGPTGDWTITVYSPSNAQLTNRNINRVRIYRTVTDSTGSATFYQIAELPIGVASSAIVFHDSFAASDITNNSVLSSVVNTGPPDGLDCVVMMANGIMAGTANGREIWFSASFMPHSWPAIYALTVDYTVVGMAAIGSMLNVLTEGQPSIATGTTPDTMTIGKITANEPCVSRGSIFPAGEGVYYASPNGLILINTTGTINVTQFSMEREFFESLTPEQWASGRVGLSYTAMIKGASSSVDGVVLDHVDKNVPCALLQTEIEPGETLLNLYWDEWSGQLFIVHTGGVHWWMQPSGGVLLPWVWKSKKFRLPKPAELMAFKINFSVPREVVITPPTPQGRNTDQAQVFDPTKQYLIVRVYADGEQIVVREIVQDNEVLLIPSGQKRTYWEFQFEGQVNMYLFKVATSVKELIKS